MMAECSKFYLSPLDKMRLSFKCNAFNGAEVNVLLPTLNLIIVDLEGVEQTTKLAALNEICTLVGGVGNHATTLDAVNELCTLNSAETTLVEFTSLQNLYIALGGVGSFTTELAYWSAIQQGGLLNVLLAPTLLTASVFSDTQINLSWVNSISNYDGVKIYQSTDGLNFSVIETLILGEDIFEVTGLTKSTVYYFVVVAYKGSNDSTHSNMAYDVTYATELLDGETVAWFDLSTVVATDNKVTAWNDKSGLNHHLAQANADLQAVLQTNGVLFDGVNDLMKSANFTFNQPEEVYLLLKPITWVNLATFADGAGFNSGRIRQSLNTPNVNALADVQFGAASLTLGQYNILTVLFNGLNSKMFLNNVETATSGNCGTNNMGGITIGARSVGTNAANFELMAAVYRKSASTDEVRASIYQYLNNKKTIKLATLPAVLPLILA